MKFCPVCVTHYRDEFSFCMRCGGPLRPAAGPPTYVVTNVIFPPGVHEQARPQRRKPSKGMLYFGVLLLIVGIVVAVLGLALVETTCSYGYDGSTTYVQVWHPQGTIAGIVIIVLSLFMIAAGRLRSLRFGG